LETRGESLLWTVGAAIMRAVPRLGPDAEGNLWVGLWRAGKLLKIDPRTNHMTAFDPPSGRLSGAYTVSVDRKNNLV